MSDRARVLAIIPARGGSKRLPRKNVLPLAGKPLIAWTIEAVIESGVADKVVVSSDDAEILAVASQYEIARLKRCEELATDTSSTMDVVLDVIQHVEAQGENFDVILLLQPTSPLRQPEDIASAYQVFLNGNGRSVVSVCRVGHPIEWCGEVAKDGVLSGIDFFSGKRSQDYKERYRLNGAIYIVGAAYLKARKSFYTKDVIAYIMNGEVSIDIDTGIDFCICESILLGKVADIQSQVKVVD